MIMEKKSGFTLIELMIVIAIIAIICAIALPGLLRSRLQTNEAAAIENLRTICGAQLGYNSSKCRYADFAALTSAVDGTGTAFLNGTWDDGIEKSGYLFTLDSVTAGNFVCYADPKTAGTTGQRWFRVDGSGVIRANPSARPSDDDPAIGTVP
jgi:prepilin-type N-terminal cleavage/methylation domain-containing protein